MKIKFDLYGRSALIVQREKGDKKIPMNGGWSPKSQRHGWEAEHQLFYRIKNKLNEMGFNLIKKRMQDDGHLCGQEATPYLRAKNKSLKGNPHISIHDSDWMIRNAAEQYNNFEPITLTVTGDIWEGRDQKNWREIVQLLCMTGEVECKL